MIVIALLKQCSKCGKKIPYNSKCECIKDSYKEYKKNRTDKDRQKLYSSKAWIRLRNLVYRFCYGLCIPCLLKGNIVDATIVHHIIPTEDDNSRWLDESNLICVCSSCHQLIHHQYNKETKNKKAMQEVLFGLLKRFEKEYR